MEYHDDDSEKEIYFVKNYDIPFFVAWTKY